MREGFIGPNGHLHHLAVMQIFITVEKINNHRLFIFLDKSKESVILVVPFYLKMIQYLSPVSDSK